MKPKVAVIGTGYWGKNLVRNYHAMGVLEVLCDKDEDTLRRFEKQYPGLETCPSMDEVLLQKDVTAVVIATPAETHFELARRALNAGKHVYVEKPLVLHEEEGEELIRIAEANNLTLMVGHLLQYHPVFVKLRELVRAGELGRINYIYSHRLNLGKIRREENILWSFAPHDISIILTLAGEFPEGVLATGANYLHKKIADVTTTHLDFPSGIRAHIFVSWLHPFKVQQLVVVGDSKMAVFDDTMPWDDKLLIYPHKIKWENNMPVPIKAEPERVSVEEREPLRAECEHFISCVERGERPLTDGHEGVRVLRILNASQKSLNSGGIRVPLGKMDSNGPQYFLHHTAIVDDRVRIGKGTRIWHFSHILPGTEIGPNCNIGQNVVIGPDVTIGENCKIQNNVSVYKGVTLEDRVFCGPSVVFTNVHNPRAHIRRMHEVRPTLVKEGATLGANCTIICGVTIGRYSFVGAGAVVTHDVPDYALVAGNPAKQMGWICECGIKLDSGLRCEGCGKVYTLQDQKLVLIRDS